MEVDTSIYSTWLLIIMACMMGHECARETQLVQKQFLSHSLIRLICFKDWSPTIMLWISNWLNLITNSSIRASQFYSVMILMRTSELVSRGEFWPWLSASSFISLFIIYSSDHPGDLWQHTHLQTTGIRQVRTHTHTHTRTHTHLLFTSYIHTHTHTS